MSVSMINQRVSSNDTNQIAGMHRLVCAFCCLYATNRDFLAMRPIYLGQPMSLSQMLYLFNGKLLSFADFFQNFFQEHYQSVKQFGSKLFVNVIS